MTSAPPLVLPPRPPRRAERRRELRRQRRRRRWQLAGSAVAVLVVIVAVVAAVVHAIEGDTDAGVTPSSAEAATGAAPAAPAGPRSALVVQAGGDGNAASLTLLSTGPRTRHILLIPPATMTEVPSFGLEGVGAALSLGGPALLQATVENLLGVSVDDLVVVDDARLTDLVGSAGDLTVDLPQRVDTITEDGDVQLLWEAGPTLVGPEEIGRLLAAKGDANDLARLARHQVFWETWLDALRARPRAVPQGSLRPYLAALSRRPPDVDLLPVEALDAGGGTELYRVRDDEVEALVAAALPDAMPLGATDRPRVQVLNGTGAVGLAQDVTVRLVQPPVRARVEYTGNADSFEHDETQVVFYDRADQATAEAVRDALGTGRVVLSRRPLGIVDITVVVGSDFEPSLERE